jgi:hypothetical protein
MDHEKANSALPDGFNPRGLGFAGRFGRFASDLTQENVVQRVVSALGIMVGDENGDNAAFEQRHAGRVRQNPGLGLFR